MSSQDVFWINAGLGVAFLALFMIRRRNRPPTQLNLRAGSASRASKAVQTISPEARAAQALHPSEKDLNVLFNYNGHTWDAHEVLGLPAGAPSAMVEEAYAKACRSFAPESREFIDSAYRAIRSRH
jgi:hypothetical protein